MSDTERLIAWMERNDYDTEGLSRALGYRNDVLKSKLKYPEINSGFKGRFGYYLGMDEYLSVFGPRYVKRMSPEKLCSGQSMAQSAVNLAIQAGSLAPVKAHKCYGCDQVAQHYHHESYLEEDRLCVVPLCRTCHRRHHTGRKPLSFGVVPTAVGIVRIAIASVPA